MMTRQETVLKTLKKMAKSGELDDCTVLLAEAQAEDFRGMDKRMTSLEKKVDGMGAKVDKVDAKVDGVDAKVDRVLQMLETDKKKPTFFESLKSVMSNRVFLYILITLLCAAFGVSVGEVGVFLFKQGG